MPSTNGAYDQSTFLRTLERGKRSGRFDIQTDGGVIPLRVARRDSRVLVIGFTGAIDRGSRQLPCFGGRSIADYVPATVIDVADPSLPRSPVLTAAWYAGHEGLELQRVLPGLIKASAAACGAERVIYIGGSVGGFAALYYSLRHPGSLAIATNPQTNIERYYTGHQTRYRAGCWPNLPADHPLSRVITTDLVAAYGRGFGNWLVYLQNAADPYHVRNHFAPFLAAIEPSHQGQVLARLGYWGRDGHAAIPAHEWLAWLRAAIAAPAFTAADIQAARAEYQPPAQTAARPDSARPHTADQADDVRLAALLAAAARESVAGLTDGSVS